jgi:hypothetical protein
MTARRARDSDDKRLARGAAVVVAFAFDMAPETLFRRTRGAGAEAEARQIMLAVHRRAAVIAGEETSIQRLGRGIERDRTTVAHALHKIEEACEGSAEVDVFVDALARIVADLIRISKVTTDEIARGIEAARADELGAESA